MFRVYKDFLRQMLIICIYYRDKGTGFKEAREYARHFQSANESTAQALEFLHESAADSPTPMNASLSDMIYQISRQLTSKGENQDRDLIEAIVHVLRLPYSKNILVGSTLNRLRDVLLLPDELIDFKRASASEMYCVACGHKFETGEMTTYMQREPGAQGGGEFHCTRCAKPNFLAADDDRHKYVAVDSIKGLKAILIKKHLANKDGDAAPLPGNMLDEANGLLQNILHREVAPPAGPRAGRLRANPPQREDAQILWNVLDNNPALNPQEPAAIYYQAQPRPIEPFHLYVDEAVGPGVAPQAEEGEDGPR